MARRAGGPAFAFGGAPRVNLMPRAAVERRERAALLRRWGWLLAATMLVVGLLGGGAYMLQAAAEQRLAAANARTEQLTASLAELQPIQQKLALQGDLTTFRVQAMGTDLSWSDFLATLEPAFPDGVVISGLDLAPGGVPQTQDPTTETGITGIIQFAGATSVDMVPLIREVRSISGVIDADGWTQEYQQGLYLHYLSVTVDQSFYSGDYAAEDAQ